ncbi:MAG: PorT family protein [Chitinispirillia bacterium]|nr:PorT family protein [Chitinispirillia bacterium]
MMKPIFPITAVIMLLCLITSISAQDEDLPSAIDTEQLSAAEKPDQEQAALSAEPQNQDDGIKFESESEPQWEAAEPEPEPEIAAIEPESEFEPELESEPESIAESAPKKDAGKPASKPAYGLIKFGVRAAYSNSSVSNMEVEFQRYDHNLFELNDVEHHSHNHGGGHGFQIEAVAIYDLIDWIAVSLSPGIAFRSPFVSNVSALREWVFVVPALLEFYMFQTQFHLLGGVQLDIPLSSKMIWNSKGPSYDSKEFNRNSMDLGVVAGFDLYLREDYFIDLRYNIGLRKFMDYGGNKDSRMNQLSVGAGMILLTR